MAECEVCGDETHLSHACRYCEGVFCTGHRLPETHNCVGLGAAQTLGPEFRNTDSSEISIGDEEAAGVTASTYSTATDEKETHDCPECGKEIAASRPLCGTCRINEGSTDAQEQSRPTRDDGQTASQSRSRTRGESKSSPEPMELSPDQTVGSNSDSLISDSSPDVAPDGSLVYEDDDEDEADAETEDDDGFSRLVIAVAVVVALALYLALFIV